METCSTDNPCTNLQLESCPSLEPILPKLGYEYKVCSYEEHGTSGMDCTLRLCLTEKADVLKWVKDLEDLTETTWRTSKTYPVSQHKQKNVFRVDLHCHHNTRPKSSTADLRKGSKNTRCPSTMYVKIKNASTDSRGRNRSKDVHIGEGYPTVISLKWTHNHETSSADALRERDVNSETRQKLLDLFKSGHSPSSALDTIKYDLQVSCTNEEYTRLSADRSCCPDLQYCYRVFYHKFKTHYGDTGGEKMMLFLDNKVQDFNEKNNDECVKIDTTSDGQTIIAICTPLMKRVHSMWKFSKEMVFVDSSGNMDRQNCRVFLMLTHSPAGALPLGVAITTSESEATLTSAFKLLESVFPENSFFNSKNGPDVLMTDDCTSLRLALHNVYPESVLLLCTFHLLQAMWRWLWDSKHKVEKNHRPLLLNSFKTLVYAETEADLQHKFECVTLDPVAQKYSSFITHVQETYERRVSWSLAHRQDLRIRGNNTTAYCEAAMRILKDKIFYRLKAFNVCQLTDFILTRFEDYNIRKLTDIANNRLSNTSLASRFYPSPKDVSPDAVSRTENEDEYTVQSAKEQVLYHLNFEIGTCTCPVGKTGAPCKHQAAVILKYSLDSTNFLPVQSVEMRKLFHTLATGETAMDDRWFQPLRSGILVPGNEIQADGGERNQPVTSEEDITDVGEATCRQDPQILKIQSLRAQASLANSFDQRNSSASSSSTRPTHLEDELQDTFKSISEVLKSDDVEFQQAVQHFISNYRKLTTRSHLISALRTFGKYSGASVSLRHRYKAGGMQTSSKIGVQPTSVARRKMPMGGRRRLTVGRPSKAMLTPEHAYATQSKGKNRHGLPQKRRQPAPHNVSFCVSQNTSLGKSHSSKM